MLIPPSLNSCALIFDLNPTECASWIQAWGTILAIVAAAGFTWWQHRLDVERAIQTEREATKRRLDVLIAAAREVDTILRGAVARYANSLSRLSVEEADSLSNRLVRVELLISSIPRAELPNAKITLKSMALEREIVWAAGHIKSLAIGGGGPSMNFVKLENCQKRVQGIVAALKVARDSSTFWTESEVDE